MTGNNFSEEASSADARPALWRNARLATLAPDKEGLGIVEKGAVLIENGRIAFA